MSTEIATEPEVRRTDRAAQFIVILVTLTFTGLIVFFAANQIHRHNLVEKIETTYSVQIVQGVRSDGIRDNKFMIESWGQQKECEVPTDFRNPLRCTVRTTHQESVEIEPRPSAESVGPMQELPVTYAPASQ